jgi:hypothetical protein
MFHVGIVVADIRRAVNDMESVGIANWTPVAQADSIRRAKGGSEPFSLLWSFSAGPGAHLELIEALIAPVSMTTGIHHVGYWSTDLVRDADLLAAASYQPEFDLGHDADDDPHIRFFTALEGPRIELVSESLRPGLEIGWAAARCAKSGGSSDLAAGTPRFQAF